VYMISLYGAILRALVSSARCWYRVREDIRATPGGRLFDVVVVIKSIAQFKLLKEKSL